MTERTRPALNDFVAGYPGPANHEFPGGLITVVAALIYADGIRIEWRMPSTPQPLADARRELTKDARGPQEFIEALFRAPNMRGLWAGARLSDEHGREFELAFERSGPLDLFGGSEGTVTCRCEPLTDSKSLTLHFAGADVLIPLTHRRLPENGEPPIFRGGYPGPKQPIPFHDGAIKIISALLYDDRVRIEWLAHPVPDLSWLFKDTLSDYVRPTIEDEAARLEAASFSMNFKRTFALWLGARLADDVRTSYRGSLGNSGVSTSGFKGEVYFTPSVPLDARELDLVLYDVSVRIPLSQT